jgi:hypothetical protein
MRQKWPIFSGIVLLSVGIVLKAGHFQPIYYLPFLLLGGTLKVYYIIGIIRKGVYRPGIELLSLVVGLSLFFTGIILKNSYQSPNYLYWMVPGLTLKIIFVLMFVLKIRKYAKE